MSDDADVRVDAVPRALNGVDAAAAASGAPAFPLPLSTPPRRRASRRHTLAILGTAVAATLLAVLAGTSQASTVTAVTRPAVTPPLAQLRSVHDDAAGVLTRLARTAAAAPPATSTTIDYQTWNLDLVTDPAQTAAAQFIQPREVTVARGGATVSVVARAGTPFADTGAVVIPASAHPAGQIIAQYTMEDPVPEPPESSAKWAAYLARTFGVDASAPAGEILMQVPTILDSWRLDAAQTSAMLTFLSTAHSLEVAGSGRDRLGRRGTVLVGPSADGQHQARATIEDRTGRVLAVEVVYTGGTRADLSSPCVTSYTAWRY
ncbi:hypothetical protein [Microbacterium terrisoli]|uniref:hypothetical protein n=1 Tax=Microbacterium terrisoli TaxID=3242192 RepID=UPI002805B5D6|nr:hypothetical protein [Microbacterium protaetiae]